MSELIVIVGVTGIQGSSVAHTFLSLPGWKVRGISRNPSSPAAQALTAQGLEIVQGDLNDPSTLLPAFTGATAIFSNTDFFNPLFQALADPSITGDRTALQYAFDTEVRQGLNIASAAASPTVLATLNRFILSSLSDAIKCSGGKYTTVYHNNSKTVQIETIKTQYPHLAAKMSLLQIGHYVTNWKQLAPLAPRKQADGSYLVQRTLSPELPIPFVVAERDTGAFVKALVLDLPAGLHLLGTSEEMTWPRWTELWGRLNGVKAVFRQVDDEEFFLGVPGPLVEEMRETFRFVDEFGYKGGDVEVVSGEELGVSIPVTSVEEYIRAEDWSSVL